MVRSILGRGFTVDKSFGIMPVSCSVVCLSCLSVISFNVQLFYSFFKSLVGKEVIVELKNDLRFVVACMPVP